MSKALASAAVLEMLADQIAGGPPPVVLPEFLNIEVEQPETKLFSGWITPASTGMPRRVSVKAKTLHEAHGLVRQEARRLFPTMPFTTQVKGLT